jgi:hypothetical protein
MSISLKEALDKVQQMRTKIDKEIKENKTPSIDPKTIDLIEKTARNMYGDFSAGRANLQEALTSTDTIKLIPKVIEGKLREAAEPAYLGTNFFNTIHVDGGSSAVYVIPVVGELYAHEVGEGSRYQEQVVDVNTIENSTLEVRVKKIGTKVSITEEAITDSSWDILGLNVRKMGKAMARYKEEWIFNTFSDNCHQVFNNEIRSQVPEAGTTGRDENGDYNDTLSVEDFLDMALTVMSNGFVPTDVIMHPLTWVVFARNSMIGNGMTYGALGGNDVHFNGQIQGTPGFAGLQANGNGQKLIMKPEQVQNRLPMPLTMNFSPFVKFDKQNKKFDMYCLDRSEVGVIVEKEGLTTENWTDPEKDIRNLKCKERYGIGILNNGLAVTVAKGLAIAPSYPVPPTIKVQTEDI